MCSPPRSTRRTEQDRPFRPLRVSQIMLARGFGGAERHAVELSRHLSSYDVSVQFICHPRFRFHQALRAQPNTEVVLIGNRGPWDPVAPARITSAVRRFEPDIVHAHLARASRLSTRAAQTLGVPLVTNVHNYINLAHYQEVDRFVASTSLQVGYLKDQGIPDDRIERIAHFHAEFGATRPKRPSPRFRFLALGRFVKKKGFLLLLDAFTEVLQNGVDATLVIAGEGPERARLEKQVRKLGLRGRVRLPGWIDDPATVFADADCFVLPSFEEPFGIVLLEAMAAGVAIVATRCDGPREILSEDTAILTPVGDREELARAMRDVVTEETSRHRRAHAARECYLRYYTPAAIVPKYLFLYQRLRDYEISTRSASPRPSER